MQISRSRPARSRGWPDFTTAFWVLQVVILACYLAAVVWALGLHDSTGFGVAVALLALTLFTLVIWIVLDVVILDIHAFLRKDAAPRHRHPPKQSISPDTEPEPESDWSDLPWR